MGALLVVGDDIPRGTTVAGVDIGGMADAAATERLAEELAERSVAIDVTLGEQARSVPAARTGLVFDAAATVASVPPRSLAPTRLLAQIVGQDVTPMVQVDERRLARTLTAMSRRVDDAAREGAVRYDGLDVVPVLPRAGLALDQETAKDALVDGYITTTEPITLPVEVVEPQVTADQVTAVAEGEAIDAISAPVTLTVSGQELALSPEQIASVLSFRSSDSQLLPAVKARRLRTFIAPELESVGRPARDAGFSVASGKPVVVPARDGRGVSDEGLATGLVAALDDPERTAALSLESIPADLTTAEAKDLGIKRVISTFTQEFPYAAYRVTNIGLAAEKINGTVLEPGETFSLNGIVGERTPENGFVKGYVIVGNRLVEDYGGAVSTITTAAWHTAFFAGMTRLEQRAHGYWISRYLPGLEATVSWGNLDLKFRNDTPYGVLVTSSVTDTSVTVTMWSTKYWDIDAEFGPRTNPRPAGTVYDAGEGCVAQYGVDGFDITVTRVWSRDGEVKRREPLATSYSSAPTVICAPEPQPEPTKSPSPDEDKPGSTPSPKPSPSDSGGNGGGDGNGNGGGGNGGGGGSD